MKVAILLLFILTVLLSAKGCLLWAHASRTETLPIESVEASQNGNQLTLKSNGLEKTITIHEFEQVKRFDPVVYKDGNNVEILIRYRSKVLLAGALVALLIGSLWTLGVSRKGHLPR